MRVTDSMLFNQTAYNVDQAQSRLQALNSQASTGVVVTHPWDNPGQAGLAVTYQVTGARFGAIAQAVSSASQELNTAAASLTTVNDALTQALGVAMQMGSDAYTPAQRTAAATEVVGIQNSIVGALNAQVANRYVFGGTIDNAAPFSATGAYSGNASVRQVEVAPGVYQDASVRADVAIKGVGGGVDVFAALGALSTALSANNAPGVIAAQAGLRTAMEQVQTAQAQAGTNSVALNTAQQVSQAVQADQNTGLSNAVNGDEVTLATQLAQAQTAYQAAITASQKTFQLSFINAVPSGG